MNKQITDSLRLTAANLGPVASLDATLSKNAQNLIYARNGTGKSFLTRALRYLDLQAQGQDVSDAAFSLVSEESADSRGSFALAQGSTPLGSLDLHFTGNTVSANSHDRVFHVFSDDFVQTDLRQRNFDMDGNFDGEIQLDQINIDTTDAEKRLADATGEAHKKRADLAVRLESGKTDELVGKASVRRQLAEFGALKIDSVLSASQQPELPERTFKVVVSDLDALKSIPADPDYPAPVKSLELSKERLHQIDRTLGNITSPSSVSADIKQLMNTNPGFFEDGLHMLGEGGDQSCPFCNQSVAHPPARDRIELYLAYFADAEGKHKKELRGAWSDIKNYRGEAAERVTAIAREAVKYEALRKLVPSLRDAVLPDFSRAADEIDAAFQTYLEAIRIKGETPSSIVDIPDASFDPLLSELNQRIDQLNEKFVELTTAIKTSDNERKRLQRAACAAFEIEFVHSHWAEIDAIYTHYQEAAAAQTDLDALKKSQLSASAKERVAKTFEVLIGTFFGQKYSFDHTDFVLKRDNKKMARGASRTLSEGEKTAIAFCYFIACAHKKVRTTSDYSKLFFVFDDPITSMSYDFVFSIAQTLKNISISATGEISINPADIAKSKRPDLLVFTHSSYFYNICVTNRVVKDGSAFFLHVAGKQHKLSKRAQYAAPFEQHLKEVVDVHNGRDPDHTTGNAVRCILEAIGRFCHPDKSSLSDFITYLAGEGGFEMKSVLINNLSHGTYYDETPSPDELKEACTEAIAVVERYARGQLEMVRQLSDAA
ncbi:MAG: AAA family ATPase [Devosia sp.]